MSTVRVFRLDDCEWWAGNTLEECIAAARTSGGSECYEGAELEGHELDGDQMDQMKIVNLDDDEKPMPGAESVTFREYLALLIERGQAFPCLFASTEW